MNDETIKDEITENEAPAPVNLIHCIYASSATTEFTKDDLLRLLAICRENNGKLDVSGMLLFHGNSFFQILEGEESAVMSLYEKISRDERHNRVLKIIQEPIEKKSFAEWTMGYADVDSKFFPPIDGLNDFFSQGNCFWELEEGRARKLLQAFKDGRWRSTIC